MAGAKNVFRLLRPGRRTALHSRWRHHPRIRRPAHGRDAELSAGEFAEALREVSDADAAGACVGRDGGRSVGWATCPAVARRAKAEARSSIQSSLRGAERRSNPSLHERKYGLLRYARNDGERVERLLPLLPLWEKVA